MVTLLKYGGRCKLEAKDKEFEVDFRKGLEETQPREI